MRIAPGWVIVVAVAAGCSRSSSDPMRGGDEAKINLKLLEKHARAWLIENAKFPVGHADLTPATPCCASPDRKCAPDPAAWKTASVWDDLDFSVVTAGDFQYSYDSPDGMSLVATAVGDPGCTGKPVTWKLVGDYDEGNPTFDLEYPAR